MCCLLLVDSIRGKGWKCYKILKRIFALTFLIWRIFKIFFRTIFPFPPQANLIRQKDYNGDKTSWKVNHILIITGKENQRAYLIIDTRSSAALRAADLDWIVGPGHSWGRYIYGCSQRLASCLRLGLDLTWHFLLLTRGHNWPLRWERGAGQE